MAGFDMDWTLIKTKSGLLFAKNGKDWQFLYEKIIEKKLKDLHADGFKIVIFTNQGGVATGNTKIIDLKEKFISIQNSLERIPILFLAAIANDKYRKPSTGMFAHFE